MNAWRQGIQTGIAAVARFIGGSGLRRLLLRRSLPSKHESVTIPGLRANVRVLIDRWGVPHIEANDPADLFFTQGYCHARDRLWQMELNRRVARGELAELFGKRLLSIDRFNRRLGFRRAAEAEVLQLSAEARALAESYAAGVNAYVERHRLPIEFQLLRSRPRPWQPVDSLAFGRYMGWTLSFNWETELIRARLITQLGPEAAAALEPGNPTAGIAGNCEFAIRAAQQAAQSFEPLAGLMGGASNNWVVAGHRSANGRALLASDPHLRPRMPAIWYMAHLRGGGFNIIGATLPGALGVLIGHNEHIAWGITASLVDTQDLFLEKPDPANPRRFAFGDEWYDAQVIREEIRIRGQEHPFVEEVVRTRHGPLMNGTVDIPAGSTPLAMRCTMDDLPSPTEALLKLNRASDWPAFRSALECWTFPVLNFVYADVDNNIGYQLAGRVPVRASGDGYVPVPGWSGDHEWLGSIPFEQMPCVFNPPEGLFATANTRPDVPCNHFLTRDWMDDNRWRRIMERLRQPPRLSLDDCQSIQMDVVSEPARMVARRLHALTPRHEMARQALAYLAGWDGNLGPDSVAAAIYEVFRCELIRRLHRVLPASFVNYMLGQGVDEFLASVSAFQQRASSILLGHLDSMPNLEVATDAFHASVEWLRQRFGPDPSHWRWGRLHQVHFEHAFGSRHISHLLGLSRGPIPIGGDADTIAQSGVDPWWPYSAATYTVSYRQLLDVGDWDQGRFILPTGQSGHPGSPHYDDMLESWRRGEYLPLWFTWPAVEREATETITFAVGDTH
jgi:penicillin amidase